MTQDDDVMEVLESGSALPVDMMDESLPLEFDPEHAVFKESAEVAE